MKAVTSVLLLSVGVAFIAMNGAVGSVLDDEIGVGESNRADIFALVDCTSTKTCPTSSLQCVQSSKSSTKFVCCGKDCTPDGKVDHCHGRKEEHCSGECCKDCTVNDPCGLGKVCKEKVCQECVHFCSIFEICTNTAQPCRVKACSECIAQ